MTKERLRNYQNLKREQTQLRHQLEVVETALYYPKIQKMDARPHGGKQEGNPMEDLAIHHIELQERYRAKLAELAAEQLEIEKALDPLPPTARMLLRYRYIDGLKWEEVCMAMSYSWRQVHRLHGEALKQLREQEEH